MEKRIFELLANRGGSYILPFFWQHGESEEKLREYMGVIYDSNIREVCVECRPHPDFCGPRWWHDMDIIMDEARKRRMRVWLLDDSHFPTGYANGAYEKAEPELLKQYLNFITQDVAGPVLQATMDIQKEMEKNKRPVHSPIRDMDPEVAKQMGIRIPSDRVFEDDRLAVVVAYRHERENVLGECINLTNLVKDGILTWDVPEGFWRIYAGYITHNGGGESDYMFPILAPSVKLLLENVYEPHYQRYKADFGSVFAGFFSDEPLMGNKSPNYDPHSLIGTVDMYMPWNEDVEIAMEKALGADYLIKTSLLWSVKDEKKEYVRVRYSYMDAISDLVSRNFSMQVGQWCDDHGVEYIGHLVEDENVTANLALGLGNYYRAQRGQHMAGIDVIGGGTFAGGENRLRTGRYYGDGDFYHYYLGKMGAGCGHVDPRKQGRSMVELYGAYGWDFGVKEMKYVTNHFLRCGINHYVPHAFSPKEFPDPDCPPHFYANGENPQYRFFGMLMNYIQRVAHLTNGGRPAPLAALLSCDEALWVDDQAMRPQKVARELTEHQIDFGVIFPDILDEKNYRFEEGTFWINQIPYFCLVVPGYGYVKEALCDFAKEAKKYHVPVIFVGKKPDGYMDGSKEINELRGLSELLELDELGENLRRRGISDILLDPPCKKISYYHYKQEKDIYILTNEGTGEVYEGEVFIPISEDACIYDALYNEIRSLNYEKTKEGIWAKVTLAPYEQTILVMGEAVPMKGTRGNIDGIMKKARKVTELTGFDVSICENKEYPAFGKNWIMERPENIARWYPDFSGWIRYETTFQLEGTPEVVLELTDAYECVDVYCNGQLAGSLYAPRYQFDLTDYIKPGINTLRIEVATTLDRKARTLLKGEGFRPAPSIQAPTGLIGAVRLYLDEQGSRAACNVPLTFRTPLEDPAKRGKVETLRYASRKYDGTKEPLSKYAKVYLPWDFNRDKTYRLLLLLHGGGGSPDYWFTEEQGMTVHMLDHMVEEGILKDTILITPTFYHGDEEAMLPGTGSSLVTEFQHELRNDLLPAIERTYPVYRDRDHRAFAGLSMGAMTTHFSAAAGCLDLFAWFAPFSGCAGPALLEGSSYEEKAQELAEALNVRWKEYDIKGWFACNGDADIAYQEHREITRLLVEKTDKLNWDQNCEFMVIPGGEHCYKAWAYDLYHVLPRLFQKKEV